MDNQTPPATNSTNNPTAVQAPPPPKSFLSNKTLIVFIVVLILILGATVGIYIANSKSSSKQNPQTSGYNIPSLATVSTSIAPESTTQNKPSADTLEQLKEKMSSYKNYQLDLTVKFSNSSNETNWTILRADNKQLHLDAKLSPIVAFHSDSSIGKMFTYLQDKNKYGETSLSESDVGIGLPQYYFRNWSSVTTKGEDTLDGQKVNIYENTHTGTTRITYISEETGLPVKEIEKTSEGLEMTVTFKFSKINQIKESKVTLPSSAIKIANL